jgi:hypothetical protein
MEVNSFSFSFIIDPFSLIYIPTGLDQSSLSVCHIIPPVALIEGSIFPDLFSSSIPLAIFPLSVVDDSILKLCWLFPLIGVVFCEIELTQAEVGILDSLWADL